MSQDLSNPETSSTRRDLRIALLQATRPAPEVQARLVQAVSREVAALRSVDALARGVGRSPQAVSRLHERLAARPREERQAFPLRWALGGLMLGGLALAALLLGLPRLSPPRDDPLEHVKLAFNGLGHVEREGEVPTVVWEDGRVDVALEPNVGARLAVQTPEARVEVVGTLFSVEREKFATRVEVQKGIVEVTCVEEPKQRVTAGQSVTCLPMDPATLLRRVVALGADGDPAERRATLEAALARVPAGHPLRAELLARWVELLAKTSEAEAVVAAREYVASGAEPRRRAMLGFIARHQFAERGCEAIRDLRAAVDDDPTSALGVPLASCLAATQPEEARQILSQVADAGPWAELRARLLETLR